MTGLPPYSYQYTPFLINIVGVVVDRSLFSSPNNLISPSDDGLDVLFNVTLPVVITYNRSPSLEFAKAIVSTLVEPDSLTKEFVGVTDDALATVSGVNPIIPSVSKSLFHAFTETCLVESLLPVATTV